jgi:tetratricopeptide (TPR) repeat protein
MKLDSKGNVSLFALSALLIMTVVLNWPRIDVSAGAVSSRKPSEVEPQENDLDAIVRSDFFAGMMGNRARLDRAMKYCEALLAKNPKHGEALVWHGGGLLVRAVHAYTKGDGANGDKLWKTGIEEMNHAAALEPDNMKIKIGRSATLIGYAQSGWDPSDSQSRVLLESALLDYEEVYRRQTPNFSSVPIHSRGELLFGLASGWSILGNDKKAREYLNLILSECKDTSYEAEARRWLARKWPLVVQHDCVGCHVSRSG